MQQNHGLRYDIESCAPEYPTLQANFSRGHWFPNHVHFPNHVDRPSDAGHLVRAMPRSVGLLPVGGGGDA